MTQQQAERGLLASWIENRSVQEYDVALKLLLRRAASRTIRMLSDARIEEWLDVELPKTQNLRMDLLGQDADGKLYHFELQSRNDAEIGLRMAEYALGARRLTGKFPRQVVVYVGRAPMKMPHELLGGGFSLQYHLVDIRELDGAELIGSAEVGDNVIAILARLRDRKKAVRKILAKLGKLSQSERDTALRQLMTLAGLRGMELLVKEEVEKMPLEIDLMENKVLGPAIRKGLKQGLEQGLKKGLEKGLEKGRQEGRQQGLQEGSAKGALRILRMQIQKRFGSVPRWAATRLSGMSVKEIEVVSGRIFDASSVTDLFA